jgi:hypothetical protein
MNIPPFLAKEELKVQLDHYTSNLKNMLVTRRVEKLFLGVELLIGPNKRFGT